MKPQMVGHIWPRNSRGKQLLIAQVADDGPEIISYGPAAGLFRDMRRVAFEEWVEDNRPWVGLQKQTYPCWADLPFPGEK